ncbi:MAG: enoyl-CoA hydratase/isomerase family protein [Chloroflexi bacterium]|nr:enoyl-CoA hydratase/isomerase family protein [Chloroflexota bacterium]
MSENWILTQPKGYIFEIILNRPDKRNAIHAQLLSDLAEAVGEAEKHPDARLIVIRGEGKAFSTGLDLLAIGGSVEMFGPDWMENPHIVTRHWQRTISRLTESTLPTIALIHGYCLGAGLELALACDFRYAAEGSIISLEETRLGIIPDAGGTTRLMGLIGIARAKEMIFTAKRIDATTAEKWGLVHYVMPKADLANAAAALAEQIAGCAPLAVAAAKRVIQGIADEATGLHLEAIEQAPLFKTRDIQEGMQAAIERRPAEWKRR